MDQIVEAPERDVIVVGDPKSPKRQPRRFPYVTVVILLIVAGGGYWIWSHHVAAPAGQTGRRGGGDQTQSVGVATVGKGDVPITLDGLGTVTSLATVTVKTQINGQLTQIGYTEGQIVNKGDFLAQIDPRPYQVALEQAQGALTRDQASLDDAKIDLTRYQKLNSQDSIARQTVDTQQALVRQDQGTIQTDQAAIDSAKLNLVYAHIVSPAEGRVGLRQVDAGNYVQTSDTTGLVVITQLQPISVIFTQPEDRIASITDRLKTGATLQVTIYDRAGEKLIATGSVATLDNQIDTTTGTVKLRAMFPNADLALFPNQFVNARLLLDTLKDATTVPTAAIQVGPQGSYVYVVKADQTVTVRQLKLGPASGDKTAVTSGLEPGDTVVVDGIDRLREGAKVRVPDPNAPAQHAKGSGGKDAAAPAAQDGQKPAEGAGDKGATDKGSTDQGASDQNGEAGQSDDATQHNGHHRHKHDGKGADQGQNAAP